MLLPPGGFKSQKNNSCTPCMRMLTKLDINNSVKGYQENDFFVEINCRTFEKQLAENGKNLGDTH